MRDTPTGYLPDPMVPGRYFTNDMLDTYDGIQYRYALVQEEGTNGGPDDGCLWSLFDGKAHEVCYFTTQFLVVDLFDHSEPYTPQGFVSGAYCHIHALKALNIYNSKEV